MGNLFSGDETPSTPSTPVVVEPPVLIQGSEAFPVNYMPGAEPFQTTLDPYGINMKLDYGPISIYNDDRTITEDLRETSTGWYFMPVIDGATISLYEGEIVVMYVQIQSPFDDNEYESWSCSTTYKQKDSVYVGEVYNYNYGTTKLDNDAVERDSATPAEQTYEHPEYSRAGPWMAANALKWYTQIYSIEENYSSVSCTAVRRYGENQKGFFDLPIGETVKLRMGYRVYESEADTRPRMHRDYNNISFELLSADAAPAGSSNKGANESAEQNILFTAASIMATITALTF